MARINLLPWRAERRAARKKQFTAMLGLAALVGLALSAMIWMFYKGQLSGQTARNDYVKGQIAEVDKQLTEIKELDAKKADLLKRKQAIEELQANRYQMVHLFDSVVRTLPDGIVLTQVKQEGDILTIDGRAESQVRVASYMRSLAGSGWMTSPEVNIIENAPATAPAPSPGGSVMNTPASVLPYQFNMRVKVSNPNAAHDPNAPPPVINTISAPLPPGGATPATAPPAPGAAAPAPAAQPAVQQAAPAPLPPGGQPPVAPQPAQPQPGHEAAPAQPAPAPAPGSAPTKA